MANVFCDKQMVEVLGLINSGLRYDLLWQVNIHTFREESNP